MSAAPSRNNSPAAPDSAGLPPVAMPGGRLKICIVSAEFIGPGPSGATGMVYTAMAQALTASGHSVTCLFLGSEKLSDREWGRWVEKYRGDGLELKMLPHLHASALAGPANLIRSYEAFQWLKKHDHFDIIHFPERNGPGYHSLTAKHHGLAFKNTTICVGIHKLTAWLHGAETKPANPLREVDTEFMERKAVAMADAVIGPNHNLVHWISDHRSEVPEAPAVRAVPLPDSASASDAVAGKVDELVYYGRLEAPRGLALFCDALDLIAGPVASRLRTVTFLGTEAIIDGLPARNYIEKRAQLWPFAVQFISDLHETGTMNYLRQSNRLAVIPSLVEGSPYRVLECLVAGIAFVATRVGGVPKLIAAEDVEKVCFDPNPEALCATISGCLIDGIRPARPAAETRATESAEASDAQTAIHALSIDPANVVALKVLARMHLNSNLLDAAREACQWVLKVNAEDAEARQILDEVAQREMKSSKRLPIPGNLPPAQPGNTSPFACR